MAVTPGHGTQDPTVSLEPALLWVMLGCPSTQEILCWSLGFGSPHPSLTLALVWITVDQSLPALLYSPLFLLRFFPLLPRAGGGCSFGGVHVQNEGKVLEFKCLEKELNKRPGVEIWAEG